MDPARALAEIRAQIDQPGPFGVLLFCSPAYDLPALAEGLAAWGPRAIMGCTTAGMIGPGGYQTAGITAVSFADDTLRMSVFPILKLQALAERGVSAIGDDPGVVALAAAGAALAATANAFALLLVDGLSLSEEVVIAALYRTLGDIPIVGGSAGDDLRLHATHVYYDGQFRPDIATVALVESSRPLKVLKFQDMVPTPKRLVVTGADESTRHVFTINGEPARDAYAAILGIAPAELTLEIVAAHPLMLCINDTWYVRAVRDLHPDGSMTFFCAISEGLVLSVGRALDSVEVVRSALEDTRVAIGAPALLIGFDCVLRRRELLARGLLDRVGELLTAANVVGFNTYGEQFNAVHVNQTFTGVAIGAGLGDA